VEAPLARLAGSFRWQILLKGEKIGVLNRFVSELLINDRRYRPPSGIQVVIDVDPYDLM
jgi:primosomal protein N' (replication factor Y)